MSIGSKVPSAAEKRTQTRLSIRAAGVRPARIKWTACAPQGTHAFFCILQNEEQHVAMLCTAYARAVRFVAASKCLHGEQRSTLVDNRWVVAGHTYTVLLLAHTWL